MGPPCLKELVQFTEQVRWGKGIDADRIYWRAGPRRSSRACTPLGIWRTCGFLPPERLGRFSHRGRRPLCLCARWNHSVRSA
jgi:hypothetical protein